MQSIDIRTTQNVVIDYPPASLGDRILAFIVDGLILMAYVISASFLTSGLGINDSTIIFFIVTLPFFFYHLIMEIAFNGQSLGKMQMKIKVVRLDGSAATIGQYILRWILRPIDILIYGSVAMLCIILSKKNQRLGDMAAGTTVVKLNAKETVKAREIVERVTRDDNYEVTFPQVTNLTDDQVLVIEKALMANKQFANKEPAEKLAERVKEHLNLTSDMPTIKLLYTVIKDYRYLTSAD